LTAVRCESADDPLTVEEVKALVSLFYPDNAHGAVDAASPD